jgi:hypothetical protein
MKFTGTDTTYSACFKGDFIALHIVCEISGSRITGFAHHLGEARAMRY